MNSPVKRLPINVGILIRAASQGKHGMIKTMLEGRNPTVQLSNCCTLAVSQAAMNGHARVVDQLLPWTTRDDVKSPVEQSTKHDQALLFAIEGKHWECVALLASLVMKSPMGRSLFIEHAPEKMVQNWFAGAEVLEVYKTMVKKKTWSDLDGFAQFVNEPLRRDWLKRHGNLLPNTLTRVTAADRAEKAGSLSPGGTTSSKRRLRS